MEHERLYLALVIIGIIINLFGIIAIFHSTQNAKATALKSSKEKRNKLISFGQNYNL